MMLAPSTYRRTSTFRLASEPYLADMRVAFPGWYTDMSHGLMNLGVRDDEWIPFATWKPVPMNVPEIPEDTREQAILGLSVSSVS